jgi:hypothetical protein
MSFTNHEGITFSIKGWDGHKYIRISQHVTPENALFQKIDPTTALLKAFYTSDGSYFFKAAHHNEASAAENIRSIAQKVFDSSSLKMVGTRSTEEELPKQRPQGIIKVILDLRTASIRECLGPEEGYYKNGNLYYPDKVLFDLK